MNIDILTVGELQTNCYILSIEDKCLIIDPGAEENFIVSRIREKQLIPLAILITHNHSDHIGCLDSLKQIYGIESYDYNNLFEKQLAIGPFKFQVIYTPGHSSDSVTYYFSEYDVMFTGDFIFYESVGRVDLPTGSYKDMIESIDKIGEYPNNTKLYPGHGKETTLEHEKENNEFFDFDK